MKYVQNMDGIMQCQKTPISYLMHLPFAGAGDIVESDGDLTEGHVKSESTKLIIISTFYTQYTLNYVLGLT